MNIVFVKNGEDANKSQGFIVCNDHLWKRIFEELAFLSESNIAALQEKSVDYFVEYGYRSNKFNEGYNQALEDVHQELLNTYLAEFEWLDINTVLEQLKK